MSPVAPALLPACSALAWKELRTHGLGALLGAAVLAVVAAVPGVGREVALFLGAPALAALFGGAALGGERPDGTLPFLAARPVPASVRDAVHFGTALALTLLVWVAGSVAATVASAGHVWLDGLQLPARLLLPVSAALTLSALCIAYASGALMREALTAVLAGLVVAAIWSTLLLILLARLGGGIEQGLARLAPALLALALPPAGAALAVMLRSGEGLAEQRAERPLRRALTYAGALSLLGLGCLALALPPALDARAVRLGHGEALSWPVLAAQRDAAVAFVAKSPAGATQAVVLLLDLPGGHERRLVLPSGTVPVGWAKGPRALLLVAWPEGVERLVEVSSGERLRSDPRETTELSTLGAGPFRVEGGTLVWFMAAERRVLFPVEAQP